MTTVSGTGSYFGYRLKVPLALTGVALVSGLLVALTTYALVDRHVQANAEAETQRLTATLARALVQPVLRGDIWQAYQTVRAAAPHGPAGSAGEALQVVVLDAAGLVFASSSPRAYALGQYLSTLSPPMEQASRRVYDSSPPAPARVVEEGGGSLIHGAPVVGDDEALLGVVLIKHPRALTDAQRTAVVERLALLGALAMAVVALAGGLLGLRMTAPIERLRAAMQAAPLRRHPGKAAGAVTDMVDVAEVCARNDEVGELGRSFRAMMDEIDAKQELERHMLQAERMASIGQLSAGIAHEVNNPLGGMLAAIENRRLRGSVDEHTMRTLALLERGLCQVHDTVQALLNEARSERHPLTPADLHDLELLLQPEAAHARCRLEWQLQAPSRQGLPAVPVRQVVLNLTLNAIAAAGPGGRVRVWAVEGPRHWEVRVANSGARLAPAQLAALTQGDARAPDGRLGLGLWITARILHTADGELRLDDVADPAFATVLVAAFPWSDAGGAEALRRPGQRTSLVAP